MKYLNAKCPTLLMEALISWGRRRALGQPSNGLLVSVYVALNKKQKLPFAWRELTGIYSLRRCWFEFQRRFVEISRRAAVKGHNEAAELDPNTHLCSLGDN